jgi:purine-binding chemotaxis protein CheW
MVDLVKIRKKAKKKEEERAAAVEAAAEPKAAESKPPAANAPSAISEEPRKPDSRLPTPDSRRLPTPDSTAAASEEPRKPDSPIPTPISKLDRFKAEAGKRRVAQSAQQEQAPEVLLELLTFVIADEQYGIEIERIVEIVTPRAVTRVPNADRSVVGIMSLRGTIVTLVDVRGRLGHPGVVATTEDTRIIVIDFQREVIGFVVDRVLRVVKTTAAAIEPHPVVHANELTESIRGVFRAGNALTILLDLDKLLDHSGLAATTA